MSETLTWVDDWGSKNTVTHESATEQLKELYNEWPGGLGEMESSIKGHKLVIARLEAYLINECDLNQADINEIKYTE